MNWSNVKLIYLRELRDQLRDRRTLFTIAVLPLLLYPLMGMALLQVQQFRKEHASKVRIIGAESLPAEPQLIVGQQFAPHLNQRLLELELTPAAGRSPTEVQAEVQRELREGAFDAAVYFPPDFARRLQDFRRTLPAATGAGGDAGKVPQPQIFFNTASDKSKVATGRVEAVLHQWREAMVQQNLKASGLSPATTQPFDVASTDVAEPASRRAALWSKILPFIVMIWALTGAFYPAIDLCAGEKERGTLETLLSSPAARGEIVWGKLLTVMTFSMLTALLNLAAVTAMATFTISRLQKMGGVNLPFEVGPPPWTALVWLVLALIPISALFSALSLAIAAFARSSKEGQYYLMPMLMISLPLMMLPMLPAIELDLGYALIPLSGVLLLLRALIEGQYLEALRYSVPVVGVTAVCCLLAIRWAIDQFNNEAVLFRESERFGLGLWIRHLVRDRMDTPTVGEALLCGVLILIVRFFAGLTMAEPTNWRSFVTSTLTIQLAFVAAPACLMAIMLTRKPLLALSLARPSFLRTIPAAGLLALLLHPVLYWLAHGIELVYPQSPGVAERLAEMLQFVDHAPLWQALLLIALAPAICEELAFRGFILSGLRHLGHKWGAIVLASVFFGLTHFMLQQSISACVIGIVIGYVAVKTGSIFPGMLYHFVHNGSSLLLSRVTPDLLESYPLLKLVFTPGAEPGSYFYRVPFTVAAALLGLGLLWWFQRLPYHRSAEERLQEALDHQEVGGQEPAARSQGPALLTGHGQ
ncbi:MAG TPA: ABC transporter permease subunit/CPBP intramembrane protease [Pirellulaceae bacterium]|nr:ABC transporter permease subunit/CPBP intramembrane protease [Pirellulaceae bacterium]